MTYNGMIYAAGNVIVVSFLIPLLIFIVRYARYSPWHDTALGRNVLYQKSAISLVVLILLLGLFYPDFTLRSEIRFVAYAAVAYSFWFDVVTLIKIQRQYPLNSPKSLPRFRRVRGR
jgi:hypothetical protein